MEAEGKSCRSCDQGTVNLSLAYLTVRQRGEGFLSRRRLSG